MQDKTIRRRRLVLLALVAGCLLLLTASFGGSGGALGSVQRDVSSILTPIQEGASRALKPVRDGAGWVGDTWDARGENRRLKSELAAARQQNVDADTLAAENAELRALRDMNERAQIQDMGLKTGRVIGSGRTVINQVVRINLGADDGVRAGQPVVTGGGLVGTVETVVGGNAAMVELLTDADFGAGVKIVKRGVTGTVTPATGKPRELRMTGPGAKDTVQVTDVVVTSGTSDPKLPSLFPPDVPVGVVYEVDDPGSDSPLIRVRPFVDVRDLNFVEVVTRMDPSRS